MKTKPKFKIGDIVIFNGIICDTERQYIDTITGIMIDEHGEHHYAVAAWVVIPDIKTMKLYED